MQNKINRVKMLKDLKRIQRIINQREIARRLKLSEPYISQIFSGKRTAEKQRVRIKQLIKSEASMLD